MKKKLVETVKAVGSTVCVRAAFAALFCWSLLGGLTAQAADLTPGSDGFYHIATLEDFKAFRDMVATDGFADKTAVLDADINLNNEEWTPIGADANPFKGTFNGNNHTISGLSITSGSKVGLFGVVEGATIRDLVVNGALSGVGSYAGLVAGISTNGITMANVTTFGSLVGTGDYTGGIIGRTFYNTAIVGCTNNAAVTVNVDNTKTGGIVGQVKGKAGYTCFVENCVNKGAITGSIVGGITGYGTFASLIGCVNEGAITEAASSQGSISGEIDARGAGGIVAAMASVYDPGPYCVSNCYNRGTVVGIAKAAGIVPNLCSAGTYATRCVNAGAVTSTYLAGGINCCCCGTSVGVNQCVNLGAVTSTGTDAGSALAAGIMSEIDGARGSLVACYNQGVITSANGSTSPFRTSGSPTTVCYAKAADGFVDSATPANAVTATTIATALGDIATATSDNEFTVTVAGNTVACKGGVSVAKVVSADGVTTNKFEDLCAALTAAKTAGTRCELLKDVDLTDVEWTPVAGFNGTFDGKGYTISGLTVVGTSNLGLFADTGTSAAISNLTITGASITSTSGDNHGVLAGAVSGSIISNVKVLNSTVTAEGGQYTGGLIGNGYPASCQCEVAGCTVTGYDQVGGLIGYLWVGHIENCFVTNNTVTATSERAGGLVGKMQIAAGNLGNSTMWLNNNVISGSATAPDYAGGICGQIMGDVDYYSISGNEIDVALDAPVTNAIGTLRSGQNAAFTGALAKNITGNWWTDGTFNGNAFTYETSSTAQTIYRGRARIGEVYYKTLALTLAAVENSATITLLVDQEANLAVPDGKSITLEGGETTLTGTLSVGEGSALTINSGTFTADPTAYKAADKAVRSNGGDPATWSVLPPTIQVGENGFYCVLADACAAAEAGDVIKLLTDVEGDLAVEESITFDGGEYTLTGSLSEAVDGQLKLVAGTFTVSPLDFLADGKAYTDNHDGTYTICDVTVRSSQEVEDTETGTITYEGVTEESMSDEQKANANSAVETLKTNLVESVTDPVAAATGTGVESAAATESVTTNIVDALQKEAQVQGLSDSTQEQIAQNIADFVSGTNTTASCTSNYLDVVVTTFDATVTTTDTTATATPNTVTYEVTPIIETTVSNEVEGVVEVVTISTVIPNEAVKEMAENGNPMTFTLQILDDKAVSAKVLHHSEDPAYPDETFTCPVWRKDGKSYITISVSHFSQFTVTTSGSVVTETDETIGLIKVDAATVGEVAMGVPFSKSGVTEQTTATLSELLTTGAQDTDSAKTWTDGSAASASYAAMASSAAAKPGLTLWYNRAARDDTSIPLTVGGYVITNDITVTAKEGLTLFTNPLRADVDILTLLTGTMQEGDQIVIEGDDTRYFNFGGAWYKKVNTVVKNKDDAASTAKGICVRSALESVEVSSIIVPAGKTFWYISAGGTPSIKW